MSNPWKLQNACQRVAEFAKKIGRTANCGLIAFDLKLLSHVMQTRDETLIAAACYLVEHNVEVIDA